jgi:hypothetical protein
VSTEQVRKRIVLFHVTGPFAGLARISGLLEGTPEQVAGTILPSFGYKEGGTGPKQAQHWKTLPRAIWYREWAQAPTGQLNDFNPAQV